MRWVFLLSIMASPYSSNILHFSDRSRPKARMILRLVSIRQDNPLSILDRVMGEILAILANSALLSKSDSRYFLSAFLFTLTLGVLRINKNCKERFPRSLGRIQSLKNIKVKRNFI